MTGWRLGYAFMDNRILKKALLVSQNIMTNISTFSQFAAVEAVENARKNQEIFAGMKLFYSQRNDELITILKEKKMEFMLPEGAFYVFIKINEDSVSFAERLLEREKIAVVPGKSYGQDFNDYFRISFAVDDYSYSRFIDWLKQYKQN
jgi:aspartate/methionine/tyrosine aminotransferase